MPAAIFLVIVVAAVVAHRRGMLPFQFGAGGAVGAGGGAQPAAAVNLDDLTARLAAAERDRDAARRSAAEADAAARAANIQLDTLSRAQSPDTSKALADANRARDAAIAAAAREREAAAAAAAAAAARDAASARAAADLERLAREEGAAREALAAAEQRATAQQNWLRPLGVALSRTLSQMTRYEEVWRYALTDDGTNRVPYSGRVRAVEAASPAGLAVVHDRAVASIAAAGEPVNTHPDVRLVTAAERSIAQTADRTWQQVVDLRDALAATRALIPGLTATHARLQSELAAVRASLVNTSAARTPGIGAKAANEATGVVGFTISMTRT